MEEILVGGHDEGKRVDKEVVFHNSKYSFSDESSEEEVHNAGKPTADEEIQGIARGIGGDTDVDSDYGGSEELQSGSSTDEETIIPMRPRYAEFNDEVDMKNPQFKIGMKFRSFKQFKDAVKN